MNETHKQMTDRWRDHANSLDANKANYTSGHCDGLRWAAKEGDKWAAENMPGWVKITEDKATWPKKGTSYLSWNGSQLAHVLHSCWQIWDSLVPLNIGLYWRPLTNYDRPPS